MSNVSRSSTTDENRRPADTTRWPVLARLPDVSADPTSGRAAKQTTPGAVEYRFDPPQVGDSSVRTAASNQSTNRRQPHAFERRRPAGHRGIPRRESPVLPRSNPFSNPRPRLIDSVAPAIRFLTMAALFTAAGIWIQMMGFHASPTRQIEVPKTATKSPAAPAKSAGDHTVPTPTATGPLETVPASGARVGRTEGGDDFASHENTHSQTSPPEHPTVMPPHFLVTEGGHVPRVQTSDPHAATDESARSDTPATIYPSTGEPASTNESDQAPAMARYPGFKIE